uniref:Uncharacterized protein n=1 Tax=Fibrocapsa japonica TaxID=94617 RepID=A0A7S2US35_9STRA|mmetsp:Transcript_1025/g.1449  ORF Transcript_1025/g.1449 Transcript_1025/m.1449 type:complete len:259 (+) Transcript_1025:109-885(+)
MGAGGSAASMGLSREQEVQVYKDLQQLHDSKRKDNMSDEEQLEFYRLMQSSYVQLVKKVGGIDIGPNEVMVPSIFAQPKESSTSPERNIMEKQLMVNYHNPKSFCVGDIIRAKIPGMGALMFEGVVMEINDADGTLEVEFDGDMETVNQSTCQRVLSWNTLEVGDVVQARPEGMRQMFTAIILRCNVDGTYKIIYEGDDEIEDGVTEDRIRKTASGRSIAARRWKKGIKSILATNAFKGFGSRTMSEANTPLNLSARR